MDFSFTDEQEMFKKTARDFLTKECPPTLVRELMEDERGYSPELWRKMAELGWQGLIFPEKYGGLEYDFITLTILLEEMGRILLPSPLISTVILGGIPILINGNEGQKLSILPKVASGELCLTLALLEPEVSYAPEGIQLRATQQGDSFLINGTKLFVPDAHVADYILCAARTSESGISLFLVERNSPGLGITPLKTMDGKKRSEICFQNVEVSQKELIGELNLAWPTIQKTLLKAIMATCAEMVGGMQKVMEMSVDYAKERVQFGRPIGSFQAIKHKCADMLVYLECARSITYYAAWAVNEEIDEAALGVSMAKAWCSDAYSRIAGEGIQVHGGIGFTWEHDLQLYFKRAKVAEFTYNNATYHREIVAQYLGL